MLAMFRRFIWPPLIVLVEYMYSMLSTPVICGASIGLATASSMVRASAPTYVA